MMSHFVIVRCETGIRAGQVQLLVELVTPHPFQVIVTLVEKLLFKEFLGVIQRGRITRAHLAEELKQSRFSDGAAIREIPFGFLADGVGNI